MDRRTRRSLLLSLVMEEWKSTRGHRTETLLETARRMAIEAAIDRTKFQYQAADYLGISSVNISRYIRKHTAGDSNAA